MSYKEALGERFIAGYLKDSLGSSIYLTCLSLDDRIYNGKIKSENDFYILLSMCEKLYKKLGII